MLRIRRAPSAKLRFMLPVVCDRRSGRMPESSAMDGDLSGGNDPQNQVELIAQAERFIGAGKADLAAGVMEQLRDLKESLPESIQAKIAQLEDLLKGSSAAKETAKPAAPVEATSTAGASATQTETAATETAKPGAEGAAQAARGSAEATTKAHVTITDADRSAVEKAAADAAKKASEVTGSVSPLQVDGSPPGK